MRLAILAVVAVLGGCATTQRFEAQMNSWVGATESDLVARLGPPQSSYALPDGSRVLQYTRGSTMQVGGGTTYQPVTSTTTGQFNSYGARPVTYSGTTTSYQAVQQPTYNVPLSCTVNFTVRPAGQIASWSASGNHCVSR